MVCVRGKDEYEAEAKYKIHLTPENPIVMDQEDDHRKEINKERCAQCWT